MKSITSLKYLSKRKKKISFLLLTVFIFSILPVNDIKALTGGPGQPEMSSFEPVTTNQMVDLFSGDLTYNIPLMDVEGYPINIAYHAGVGMEDEASWVGLGWNINPGVINRSVRGFPDDFNGETIEKSLNIRKRREIGFSGGINGEIFGFDFASLGGKVSYNNYKGFYISPEFSLGVGIGKGDNAKLSFLNYSGKGGYDIGLNLTLTEDFGGGLSGTAKAGLNYNSRAQSTTFSLAASLQASSEEQTEGDSDSGDDGSETNDAPVEEGAPEAEDKETDPSKIELASANSSVTIGMAAYAPTAKPEMYTAFGAFKVTVGGAVYGVDPEVYVTGEYNEQGLKSGVDDDDKAYGFLYLDRALDESRTVLDFARDGDVGNYNEMMENLPPSFLSYDILNVSGQGTAGSFRPFRNDVGVASDPKFEHKQQAGASLGLELGTGNLAKYGGNIVDFWTKDYGGKWNATALNDYSFIDNAEKDLFEKAYFKQAGEITPMDLSFFTSNGGDEAVAFPLNGINQLKSGGIKSINNKGSKAQQNSRVPRGKLISYLTAEEATVAGLDKTIKNHTNGVSGSGEPRAGTVRKRHHISEITHLEQDGSRYIYGIPAYNTSKEEYAFNASGRSRIGNLTNYQAADITSGNKNGKDRFFSKTTTPAYAHSYLLTGYLSPNYVDVTGDGITNDDIGNAVSFKWEKTSSNYGWRTPYDNASSSDGFLINENDDKGSFVYGQKEVWYLKYVESRNYIAVFELSSDRKDGLGAKHGGGKDVLQKQRKLESIKLYSKAEYLNSSNGIQNTAIPIKTIHFEYDYSLCKNILNHQNYNTTTKTGPGKLTLKKIKIGHGEINPSSSVLGLAEYGFEYAENPVYHSRKMDRWGSYKDANETNFNLPNANNNLWEDYPYVNQNANNHSSLASSWNLSTVNLPTGGTIDIKYESDDYAYVQNKRAMQMIRVIGAGYDKPSGACANTSTGGFSYNEKLYGQGQKKYLFFELPDELENIPCSTVANQAQLAKYMGIMFKDIGSLYFSFRVDAGGSNGYEKVKGYANYKSYGTFKNGTKTAGWVELELEKVKVKKLNPIVLTSLNFFEKNLKEYIGVGGSPSDGAIVALAKQLFAVVADLYQMFSGPINYYLTKNVAKKFDVNTALIRLNNPNYKKYGGGHRVKEVKLTDGWDFSSANGGLDKPSSYGQQYTYTKWEDFNNNGVEDSGERISSGVASYEPMAGGDENPFRQPTYYRDQEHPLFATNWQNLEELPFGESVVPPATVGYSEVKVESINRFDDSNNRLAKSAQSYVVHEFYTAKDFPFKFSYTTIDKDAQKNELSALTSIFGFGRDDKYAASQGYSFILNDMHGKKKAEKHFVDIDDAVESQLISGKEYKYRINASDGSLNHEVPMITRTGGFEGIGTTKTQVLGKEMDITIDTKFIQHEDGNPTLSANLDGFLAAVIPVVIPVALTPGTMNSLAVRNAVVSKVIQEYGILEEIIEHDENRKIYTKNELYDGHTGKVIMTSTTNEFEEKVYDYKKPAYWVETNDRMGPAYKNIGYFEKAKSPVTVSNGCVSDEGKEKLKEILYRGLIDGQKWTLLKKNKINWPSAKTISGPTKNIFGHAMEKGVFVPGDEVIIYSETEVFNTKLKSIDSTKGYVLNVIDYQDILHAWKWGLVTNTSVTGFKSDDGKTGPCLGTISGATFRSKLADATKKSVADVDAFYKASTSAPLADFADNHDVCHLLQLFPVNTADPSTFISTTDLSNYISVLQSGRTCEFMRALYDPANVALREFLKSIFASGLVDRNIEFWEAIMMDPELYNHIICNSEHPAILQFVSNLLCDNGGYLFDFVRYVISNDNFTSIIHPGHTISDQRTFIGGNELEVDEIGGDVTTWGSDTVGMLNVFLYHNCDRLNVKTHLDNQLPLANHHLNTNSPFGGLTFTSHQPQYCNSHHTVGCPSLKGNGYTNNTQTVKRHPDSLKDHGCGFIPSGSFDASKQDIVIFIDMEGNLIDLEGYYVKIVRSGRRNNLDKNVEETTVLNENPLSSNTFNTKVLGVSVKTFIDDWRTDVLDGGGVTNPYAKNIVPNPFIYGMLGSFRVNKQLSYVQNRNNGNGSINLKIEGVQNGYTPYWAESYSGTANSLEENILFAGSGWVETSEVTEYSTLGYATEEKDALGLFSSEYFGGHEKARAVAHNAKESEIAFADFEKGTTYYGRLFEHFGLSELINASNLSEQEAHTGKKSLYLKGNSISGLSYYEPSNAATSVTETKAGVQYYFKAVSPTLTESTGSVNSLSIEVPIWNPNYSNPTEETAYKSKIDALKFLGPEYRKMGFNPTQGKEYYLSVWVKEAFRTGYVYSNGSNVIHRDVLNDASLTVQCMSGTSVLNTENCLTEINGTPIIEGWQRAVAKITIPKGATGIKFTFSGGAYGHYFDDLRIHPVNSNLVAYVYDNQTHKLRSQLDENNYATFYEYDKEGNLIRVKRETQRGIKLIKEYQKHTMIK